MYAVNKAITVMIKLDSFIISRYIYLTDKFILKTYFINILHFTQKDTKYKINNAITINNYIHR